jgi:hypothetical protein
LHGFLYSGGTYTTLNDPLATNGTDVTGINDAGEIVGYYFDISGAYHGFLADPIDTTGPSTDQIPGSIQSTTELPLGTTSGTIDSTDINGGPDDDYYKVTLTGGDQYTFTASSGLNLTDTLDSVFIRLRDSSGAIITTGNTSAAGPNPSFDYTVSGSGPQTY